MENEAEHVKNRETDSTSRPSSRESEKTVSSVIDEIASIIVSDKLDRTSCNINELMQSISWWEAEERSKSETNDNEDKSSADCRINQKVKRHLKRFFGLRQIFAEHKGEPLKDTKEDLVIEMDSTQAPSGQDGHHVPTNVSTQKFCNSDWTVEKSAGTHGRNVIKRMKSTLKRHFKLKKKAAEQNLDGSPCPEDLRSNHLEGEHEDVTVEETINISSTLSLTGSSQPEEHYEVTSEVMEENLVTDIVLTPGRSEAEQKDEIAGSASSNLTSKNTNLREAPIYMEMDAPSCPEEAYPTASICSNEDIKAAEEADLNSDPVELVDVKHEDITPEAKKVPLTLSPTGSSRPVEHHEVRSAVIEDDLVTNLDSLPGPSGQDGHLEPSQVNLAAEHNVDEIIMTASSHLMSSCASPKEMSPTASKRSSEDNKAAEESGLTSVPLKLVDVADKDATPGPFLVLPGAEHADEEVRSASSESRSKDTNLTKPGSPFSDKKVCETVTQKSCNSVRIDKKSGGGHESKIFNEWNTFFRSKPSEKVQLTTGQDLDDAVELESSDSKSGSPCPEEASTTASIRSSEDNKAAEESGLTSVPLELVNVADKDVTPESVMDELMKDNLVTDMDVTPGLFLVLPGAEHADEVVGSASSNSRSIDTNLTKPRSPFPGEGPFMEMDAPSQENNKDVRVTSLTVSTQTSCDTVRTDEKSAGGRESKIFKKIKSAWNTFFRLKPSEKVQLTTGQDLDDAVELQSCDSKSGSPSPEEMSPTASIHSCEDNKAAEESDLTSVPLELVDVADKNVTPQEKEDVASKPSTLSSLPPVEHRRESFSVTEKELVKYRDSTPGPSEQDRHPEGFQEDNGAAALPQLIGLKNVFYTIIKGFFDSLTDEERREISRGVYNTDVKDKLAHNCAEVLRLVIETITDILSQAMNQFAHPHATLTRGSPTSFQACGAVGQNFVLTEDNLQQSLKNTFGEAYCEVIGTDTSVSITPKFTEAIMRAITDEVNSILSETIQASLSGGSSHVRSDTCCKFSSCRACKKMLVIRAIKSLLTQFETQKQSDCESKDDRLTDEHTAKVHEKKSPWWSCFRKLLKKKVHPVSDEQMDEAVRLSPNKLSSGHRLSSSPQATSSTCSKCSSKLNSTPLEVVDYVTEDEDFTAEDTGNTPPSDLIGWFPTACLEETVMTPKHSDCESKDDKLTDEHTIKVHENKSPWWSCFRKLLKKKVHTVSDEQMDEAVRLSPNKLSSGHRLSSSPQATSSICSKHSSEQNSTPLEVVDYVTEDEDFTEEDTGNTPPSHSIGWFPTACLEDEVIVSENQESPPLSTTQTEVRSSSCHQFSDSGDVKSDVGTEQGVTAASDTEANETQAEKSNRICPYCKRKMDNDERASAQDQAVHTKRSSLLKRIWLFCCRQNCDSYE
ncbi:uncharacterized protein LOC116051614 isoform X1 [Sander lucioperca]|uniref:uncharacterized protein LOC116051614 isoform X1 n=1 Tax=Sander lucioperca TaxID=283035 RepID=UPI0016538E47|nr:uncharacterized protein LOC116051614 isoform X1 [Sander lucioperca]